MRGRAAAGLALLGGACGAPELAVELEIPAIYRERVAVVGLDIYTPPVAAPFSCEDLALGGTDPELLRVSLVERLADTEAREVRLSALDRFAPKLFVATGRDAAGERIVVGCAEAGLVEEDTVVRVAAEPVARVRAVRRPKLGGVLGGALEGPVVLEVADLLDRTLPGMEVRWQTAGAAGTGSAGVVTTSSAGLAAIRPELPARPGPFVLHARVRWEERETESFSGFVLPRPELVEIPGAVVAYRAGRIGPAAEPGVVALFFGDISPNPRVAFVHRSSTGEVRVRTSQPITAAAARLGLLDYRGDQRDRPIVVGRDRWFEIEPDGTVLQRHLHRPIPPAANVNPVAVHPAGPCSGPDQPRVLVSYQSGGAVGVYGDEGEFISAISGDLDVLASGCVADQLGAPVRTLVVDRGDVGLQISAELSQDRYASLEWFAVPVGMSFARALGTTPPLLLGTQLNVNDLVVTRLTLERRGPALEVVIRGLDAPPAVPLWTEGGDLDADQRLDVVSLFARPGPDGAPVQYGLWTVLGREHEGARIAGDIDVLEPGLRAPQMVLADMDGDGYDDVVVAERSGIDPAARSARLAIYSMGLTRR